MLIGILLFFVIVYITGDTVIGTVLMWDLFEAF